MNKIKELVKIDKNFLTIITWLCMISIACRLIINNVSQITFRAGDRGRRGEKYAGGDRQGEVLHGQK